MLTSIFRISEILLFSIASVILLSCSYDAGPSMKYVRDSNNFGGCIIVKSTDDFNLDVFVEDKKVAELRSDKGSVALCIEWKQLDNETNYSVFLASNETLVYEFSGLTKSDLQELRNDLEFRENETKMLQVGLYSFGGKTLENSVFSIGVPPN